MAYAPKLQNSYLTLPEVCYQRESAVPFANARLIRFNHQLASFLNLDAESAEEDDLTAFFSGQKLTEDITPIALCYGGHQFGHFAGRLGDGRALLLGDILAKDGQRYDIQLKGSGPTLYSRRGDGLSALGPTLREYIVSEFMAALAVPTTRALCVCSTGMNVQRDLMEPGGIFTRVASSHLRVGTFEFFASEGDRSTLKAIFHYAVSRHSPNLLKEPQARVEFYREVVSRQARLVAQWMSIGFIHGVMNTDNTSISGETLDFGPCAFMDEFRYDKVFSFIDRHGRYAYNNQPDIMQWNLARLAECLSLILEKNESLSELEEVLLEFPRRFQEHYLQFFGRKFGLTQPQMDDLPLIARWLDILAADELDFTLSFLDLENILTQRPTQQIDLTNTQINNFVQQWQQRLQSASIATVLQTLQTHNPRRVPRNHMIEAAIEQAYHGDYELFHTMCAATAEPFLNKPDWSVFDQAPAADERVVNTFCGT